MVNDDVCVFLDGFLNCPSNKQVVQFEPVTIHHLTRPVALLSHPVVSVRHRNVMWA